MLGIRRLLLLLVVVSLLAACAEDPAADTRATTVATTTPIDSSEEFGYITDVDSAGGTVTVDHAEWLTGEEAVTAAVEDGVIAEGDELGGDFYIRNPDAELTTLSLADDVIVVLVACHPNEGPCVVEEEVDLTTWSELISAPDRGIEVIGWDWYGQGTLPYTLTLADSAVVEIREFYLP